MWRLLTLIALLLCVGCGADSSEAWGGPGGSGGDPGDETGWGGPGGPLANAGPDLRLLEGMPGRLDGRGSLQGEEGLELRWLWTQESGPRVALDDPTSPVTWFVAPPIRSRRDARLVFRLTVDDGISRSTDRVVVELVDHPLDLLPAPVALGGADQQVYVDSVVSLGEPLLLDPACLLERGADGCASDTEIPWQWTQVEGPRVQLWQTGQFVAPDREALLTFRLDAHRPGGPNQAAGCGHGSAPLPDALCSAPDFVRIFVKAQGPAPNLKKAPVASLQSSDPLSPLAPPGGITRRTPSTQEDARLTVIGDEGVSSPGAGVARFGYRPLLGEAPLVDLLRRRLELSPRAQAPLDPIVGHWPAIQAVAYEAKAWRLHAAPVPVLVSWERPEGKQLLADAGPGCSGGRACEPFVGGDRIVLSGSVQGEPSTSSPLSWCWIQTLGPRVEFEEGDGCLPGIPDRSFVAPEAPPDGGELHLAFLLVVRDGSPLSSLPDTVVVRIRPSNNTPPDIVVDHPAEVDEGARVLLDASASTDPEGQDLHFSWRQIRLPGDPLVELSEASCLVEGACVAFDAPQVTADTKIRIELTVTDTGRVSASRSIDVLVRNTENEPPLAFAGADRVVAQGQRVEVLGTGDDPNPADRPLLRYEWRVIRGGISLDAPGGPVASFRAPSVDDDLDVVLELKVIDPSGDVATDQVTITVLRDGPWISPSGSDKAAGSRHAPLATVTRGLELARALEFSTLHLTGGSWNLPEGGEHLEGLRLEGGYDRQAGWIKSPASRTLLSTGGTLVLSGGAALVDLGLDGFLWLEGDARLENVEVAPSSSARSTAVEVRGGTVVVRGSRLLGPPTRDTVVVDCLGGSLEFHSTAIVAAGRSNSHGMRLGPLCTATLDRTLVDGTAAAASSTGIDAAGALQVVNSLILAGAAPEATALLAAGSFDLHSSLLLVRDGEGARATALLLAPGATGSLRNVILDAGRTSADRAQLRDTGGGLPAVLSRVLFTEDPGCGGQAALVRTLTSGGFCSLPGIRSLGSGFDPLVGDPGFTDRAGGDFHLLVHSAAVDAGTETGAPALDYDGRERGRDGNGDGISGWDIGPYER